MQNTNKQNITNNMVAKNIADPIKKQANKKWFLITSLIISIVVFGLVLSLNYSEYLKEIKGASEIRVEDITNNEAYVDPSSHQQYITEDIGTVFALEGWYKNNPFNTIYAENGKVMMKLGKEMDPNDGIIEGYIIEKIVNKKPYAMVFLDEDFKNKVNDVKIYWGASFENSVDFDFTKKISEGIYMNEIEDDPERFENNFALHYGGVMVGDLNEVESTAIKSS